MVVLCDCVCPSAPSLIEFGSFRFECKCTTASCAAMPPKKRAQSSTTVANSRAAKASRRVSAVAPQRASDGAARGQTVASQDVALALAGALGKSAADMPAIRKTVLANEQVASVFDAIAAFKGRSCKPKVEYKRLTGRFPEVVASCYHFQFAGQGQRETPVANAKTLVEIILVLPGEQAAKVREQVSRVFVDFLGGNVALVKEMLLNRQMQERLQRENPEHWARFFGEHVRRLCQRLRIPMAARWPCESWRPCCRSSWRT